MRHIIYVMLMITMCSVLTAVDDAHAKDLQQLENVCFAQCMRNGNDFPGECKRQCRHKIEQNHRNDQRYDSHRQQQQQQMIRLQQEREKRWEQTKKDHDAALRLAEADKSLENASRVNLLCYRACYLQSKQKAYCEKHCAREENEVKGGKIDTGNKRVDRLLMECYRGCGERDDLTPACFHTCCYICHKEAYDEEAAQSQDQYPYK